MAQHMYGNLGCLVSCDILLHSIVVPGILLKAAWEFVYRAKLTSKPASPTASWSFPQFKHDAHERPDKRHMSTAVALAPHVRKDIAANLASHKKEVATLIVGQRTS